MYAKLVCDSIDSCDVGINFIHITLWRLAFH